MGDTGQPESPLTPMRMNLRHSNWILPFKVGHFITSILELLCPQLRVTGHSPVGHIPFFSLPLLLLFPPLAWSPWAPDPLYLSPEKINTSAGLKWDSPGKAMKLRLWENVCNNVNPHRLSERKLVSIDKQTLSTYLLSTKAMCALKNSVAWLFFLFWEKHWLVVPLIYALMLLPVCALTWDQAPVAYQDDALTQLN